MLADPGVSANLSMLFSEHPFLSRFAAASAAGFSAVEYLWPYAHPPDVLAGRLADAGLEQVLCNCLSGDTDAGERGLGALPGREAEVRGGIATALEYAQALRCPRVHVMAGILPPDLDRDRAQETYLDNLRAALDTARGSGVTLLLEPINAYDLPGYFLRMLAQAQAVVDQLAEPGLAIQLDWYHAVRTEPDVVAATCRHLPPPALNGAPAAGRRPGPSRARRRRRRLPHPFLADRQARVQGVGRLRVRPAGTHRGRPGLVAVAVAGRWDGLP